jgi:diguanylate cyclase (GGDEF)-like protein/PAS domain S-box-containing protein
MESDGLPGQRVAVRRFANVAVPAGLSALAFVCLSRVGALGNLPLWLPISLLASTAVSSEFGFARLGPHSSPGQLHRAIAGQILGVASIIYVIGWGPMLTIGYVLILGHALELVGSRAWRVTLLWSTLGLVCGQIAIAFGIVPSYVPSRYAHGLAILGLLGSAFVMRLLGQKTAENEEASAHISSTVSLLSATLDSTAEGILALDNSLVITLWNEQFATMWGVSREVLATRTQSRDLKFLVERLAQPDVFREKAREYVSHPECESEDILEFKDGRVLEWRTRPQRVDGKTVGRVWSFRDVTERVQLLNQLSHQAFHDSLTGLANRALLRDRIEHALARARRSGATVAVLFCDVDHFKMVNDMLGHDCGDALLVEMASRLDANLRDGDTAARLGGDEFAIVLDEVRGDDAIVLAERVLGAIREPFTVKGNDVFVRASIGVADTGDEPLDADELLCRADIAMYAAKNRGRDRYEVFHATMQTELSSHHELYGDLRQALHRNEITLHYQPLVELATKQIESFEALARWQHPTRGFVPPDQFIPLAEETGLIVELGRFVLREACRQTEQWRQSWNRDDIAISVNVSSYQLYDDSFVDDVQAALSESGLPASNLILELTETALLSDSSQVHARLNALKELGIRIAIDDFGTGYSSLAYLRSFPIDFVKIDRGFISELSDTESDQGESMVRSIIGIGHNLRMNVVAEGIEEPVQLAALLDAGCNSGQGYFFAKPLPASDVAAFVTRFDNAITDAQQV